MAEEEREQELAGGSDPANPAKRIRLSNSNPTTVTQATDDVEATDESDGEDETSEQGNIADGFLQIDEVEFDPNTDLLRGSERPSSVFHARTSVFRGFCRKKPIAIKVIYAISSPCPSGSPLHSSPSAAVVPSSFSSSSSSSSSSSPSSSPSSCCSSNDDQTAEALADLLAKRVRLLRTYAHPNLLLYMGCSLFSHDAVVIVTELMDCNLGTYLAETGAQLTTIDRLRIAREIALGMNWLHCSTPACLHGDLKPSNVLIDRATKRAKLCDFGLVSAADILSEQNGRHDRLAHHAFDPVFCAPELLVEGTIDKRTDIYSFAMLMWMLITCETPFAAERQARFTQLDDLLVAIHRDDLRPVVPKNASANVSKMITRSWAKLPEQRPTFKQITGSLELMIVDAAVIDRSGREFWKSEFQRHDVVSWKKFVDVVATNYLNQDLEFDGPSPLLSSSDSSAASHLTMDQLGQLLHLKYLLCEHPISAAGFSVPPLPGNERFTLEQFGLVLDWFGPFSSTANKDCADFLRRVCFVTSQPWFHGNVDQRRAEVLLSETPPASFLVRYSNSSRGSFTISKKGGLVKAASLPSSSSSATQQPPSESSEDQASASESTPAQDSRYTRRVLHVRVGHQPGSSKFLLSEHTFGSLVDVVQQQPDLKTACPGSPFVHLLKNVEEQMILLGYEP